jgi:hypothetical protein
VKGAVAAAGRKLIVSGAAMMHRRWSKLSCDHVKSNQLILALVLALGPVYSLL